MFRIIAVAACVCFCVAGVVAFRRETPAAVPPETSGPKLHLQQDAINFGILEPHESVEGSFTMVNKGDRLLRISEVTASCGCAKPVISNADIEPNGEAIISVQFQAKGVPGPMNHLVQFLSNDVAHASVRLQLTAEVQPLVQAVPTQVYFGTVAPGAEVEKQIRLISPRGIPFSISQIEGSSSRLDIEFKAGVESVAHSITVTWRAGRETEFIQEKLLVRTSSAAESRLVILVGGEVKGLLNVTPRMALLGSVAPESEIPLRLRLSHPTADVQSGRVNAVGSISLAGFEATAEQGEKLLEVRILIPKNPGSFAGSITIEITAPEEVLIKVPVMGLVQRVTESEKVDQEDRSLE